MIDRIHTSPVVYLKQNSKTTKKGTKIKRKKKSTKNNMIMVLEKANMKRVPIKAKKMSQLAVKRESQLMSEEKSVRLKPKYKIFIKSPSKCSKSRRYSMLEDMKYDAISGMVLIYCYLYSRC